MGVKPLHRYDQGSSYPGRSLGGGHRGHGRPPVHWGSLCLASSLRRMASCPCGLAPALCWLARSPRLNNLLACRPTFQPHFCRRLKSLVELSTFSNLVLFYCSSGFDLV